MKVYIILSGDYDGSQIVAVYSDKNMAIEVLRNTMEKVNNEAKERLSRQQIKHIEGYIYKQITERLYAGYIAEWRQNEYYYVIEEHIVIELIESLDPNKQILNI